MTEKKPTTGWDVLAVLALPLLIVFEGYVLARLWAWHVVPVFGWPSIGLGHAVGLHAFVRLFRAKSTNRDTTLAHDVWLAGWLYAIALLVGWCAR